MDNTKLIMDLYRYLAYIDKKMLSNLCLHYTYIYVYLKLLHLGQRKQVFLEIVIIIWQEYEEHLKDDFIAENRNEFNH